MSGWIQAAMQQNTRTELHALWGPFYEVKICDLSENGRLWALEMGTDKMFIRSNLYPVVLQILI